MRAGQLTSEWLRAEEIVQHVQLGDLLEFRRVLIIAGLPAHYKHWAVYIGRHEGLPFVIHLSGGEGDFGRIGSSRFDSFSSGPAEAKAEVRRDPLMAVSGKDRVRINNAFDAYRQPFPPKRVVERATQKLGSDKYNVIIYNCEHFVKWCRYGRYISDQTNIIITVFLDPFFDMGVGIASLILPTKVSEELKRIQRIRRY